MGILTWITCHHLTINLELICSLKLVNFAREASEDYILFFLKHELNVQQHCSAAVNGILKRQRRNKPEHLGKSSVLDLYVHTKSHQTQKISIV